MFTLHPTLARDTTPIKKLSLSVALLMEDSRYPWVILVPERHGLRDLHDLEAADYLAVCHEVAHVSRKISDCFSAHKINVGALGNLVPQLHIHIIARFPTDAAWPGPVWGHGTATAYDDPVREARLRDLRTLL